LNPWHKRVVMILHRSCLTRGSRSRALEKEALHIKSSMQSTIHDVNWHMTCSSMHTGRHLCKTLLGLFCATSANIRNHCKLWMDESLTYIFGTTEAFNRHQEYYGD